MSPHSLTNIEIQRCFQNEAQFNGVYSENCWPKLSDGAYVTTFDEYKSIGAHWIALYGNDDVTYFGSFRLKTFEKR